MISSDPDGTAEPAAKGGWPFWPCPHCGHEPHKLAEILRLVREIRNAQKRAAVTEQQDVDQITSEIQATDADVVSLTAQVTAGQAALDTAITNLEAQVAAGQAPDLTELKAAQAVLAGDQPNLDAAVAALSADPNASAGQ